MKHYLELVDAVGLAVIATDGAGTITHWNAAAEELYGWRAEEAIGRNILEVTVADISREMGQEIMRSLAAGHVWSGEFSVRDRDGHAFRVEVTDLPFDAGAEVTGVVGISARPGPHSPLETLLARVAGAAESLWPNRITLDVDLGGVTARASDPHVIQLLSLLLRHELHVLEEGEPIAIAASPEADSRLGGFHVFGSSGAYVRIAPRGMRSDPLLREVRTSVSPYAGALVRLAGGKLFIGGSRTSRSMHLLMPANAAG